MANMHTNNEAEYRDRDLFQLVVRDTANKEVGQISIVQDLKFMLLRHWTLHDSAYNSNYMVTQFQLWKEQNSRRFRDFLARIGVPIEQAKQKYQYMSSDLRRDLKTKILDKNEEMGLKDIL